ncbi:DNA internalization-related competence protein ComEC/Rec2 [Evansella sp. AB-P1]|uniref:DNA internalization-related competence protein ComEC/Rec2 n=1 Tax=Evansella sp. AB-P1 TaxID=3037653 RepID=UPI00241F50B4|nr:DNA internalization-related competence protein ComEC/Rec2 [Evansella sp. AB-P1]MDG5786522.1 DNA internalization-related competence protein ComEC/Rec2 [Evansella sp. AB-P1]
MLKRIYCYSLLSISGLLFAFIGTSIWSWSFTVLGFLPLIISIKNRKDCLSLLFGFFILGVFYLYGQWSIDQSKSSYYGDELGFIGKVITEPMITTTGNWSYEIKEKSGEKLQAFSRTDLGPPLFGETCYFEGELQTPSPTRNPYGFEYDIYLKQKGIHWILNTKNLQCSTYLEPKKWSIDTTLRKLRIAGIDGVMDIDTNNEASSIIVALVFGERQFLTDERITSYRQLGVLHLLAVSGLHVGLVIFAINYILSRFGLTNRMTSIILILFLPLYIVIAGGAPSVIRASLMSMTFLIVSTVRWKLKGIDVISLICIALLLYDPFLIFHLGFQLSFLTSFALIVSSKLFLVKNPFRLLMKVTFVAQLISLPLTLYHFYEISLLTLPVNLVLIPFISLWILPLSFLTVILHYTIPPLTVLPYHFISFSLKVVHYMMDSIVSWNWDMVVFGKPSNWMTIILFITIILYFIVLESNKRINSMLIGALLTFLLFFQLLTPYFRTYATITVLDVGQGDAIVVELPRRKGVYLIDTGGVIRWGEVEDANSSGPGKRVIEPFLKGNGVSKIDKLILTHGHQDHIGEVCVIVEAFKVETAYYPLSNDIPEEARSKLECILEKGIPLVRMKEGDNWMVGGQRFVVIHPQGHEMEENERSIVIYARIEGITFLFTGDIEVESEKRIVRDYATLDVNILKVSHHGSRSSSSESFLNLTNPNVAVISAGRNNIFGHPHSEVIERLHSKGIIIYRTDQNGAVQMKIKEKKLKINTLQ